MKYFILLEKLDLKKMRANNKALTEAERSDGRSDLRHALNPYNNPSK